jgi:hypothetical protein
MRFSRQFVVDLIQRRIDDLEREYGEISNRSFDDENGWAQCNGLGEATNRVYGAIDELQNLLTNLELQ